MISWATKYLSTIVVAAEAPIPVAATLAGTPMAVEVTTGFWQGSTTAGHSWAGFQGESPTPFLLKHYL